MSSRVSVIKSNSLFKYRKSPHSTNFSIVRFLLIYRGVGTGEAMKPGLHRKLELLLHRNFKHLGYMKVEIFGLHRKKARSDAPVNVYLQV